DSPRSQIAFVSSPIRRGTSFDTIPIEILSSELSTQFEEPGLRFLSADEVIAGDGPSRIEAALQILVAVPELAEATCALTRALHLLDTGDDEIDVSFSDPELPFSSFLSLPGPGVRGARLRLAEALLHEAMHL